MRLLTCQKEAGLAWKNKSREVFPLCGPTVTLNSGPCAWPPEAVVNILGN